MDFRSDEKQIEMEISEKAVISGNVEKLKLREVYRVHSDLVQEYIKKAVIFNPDYLEYLYHTYGELFESRDELYRTVFGNYSDEYSYGKRPLAKLTSDIMITKKYENVQKGVGDIMSGVLIETEARTILNTGKQEDREETQREDACKRIKGRY